MSRIGPSPAPVADTDFQRALMNILDDFHEERGRLKATQRATLNILDDFHEERGRLQSTQSAMLNILDDAGEEGERLRGTQRAVLNILEDLNAEKARAESQSRELAALNKELESFAYSASHDLRTPLRAIDGFSRALEEDHAGRLDGEALDYLSRIRAGAQRMSALIDALLDLSRIMRVQMNVAEVDLTECARGVIEELRQAEPDRRVTVAVQAGLVALGDARLLRAVMQNLISNSWKFTRKTSGARIEVGRGQAIGGKTAFFVRDNGAGFDMAYADKLFQPFQRLHGVDEFEGTGIGLATAFRVLQRHGGSAWAEGNVGRGATFWFALDGGGMSR